MQRTLWLAVACASLSLGASGCARRNVRTDEAMLGRVPMEQKQMVFTAENNVSVAQANVAAAERSVDEAKDFRSVVDRELDAAKARLDAAQKGLKLGRSSGYQPTIEGSESNLSIAQRQLAAYQAKKDYADHLVDLREKQLDAANKRYDIAKDDLGLARATVIERNGMKPREDLGGIRKSRDDKIAELAALDKRTSLLRDETRELHSTWNERRNAYNVASRGATVPSIPPPPPPKMLEPEPSTAPPRD